MSVLKSEEKIILSIDGGGIRGIVPAKILIKIEQGLRDRNLDFSMHECFDLIAGTSTGGIIALALSIKNHRDPSSAASSPMGLFDLYKDHGRSIFDRTMFSTFKTFFDATYDHAQLSNLLENFFGDQTTEDYLSNFLVTAYDIELRKSRIFSSLNMDPVSQLYHIRELARATSAAPTFFEPALVRNLVHKNSDSKEALIDGGVFAADPAFAAYMTAIQAGWEAKKITIISLGTGTETKRYVYHDVRDWGNIDWISPSNNVPIVSILMQGQTHFMNKTLEFMINQGEIDVTSQRYFKIDGPLNVGSDSLDDARAENIDQLENFADRICEDQSSTLGHIVDILEARLRQRD